MGAPHRNDNTCGPTLPPSPASTKESSKSWPCDVAKVLQRKLRGTTQTSMAKSVGRVHDGSRRQSALFAILLLAASC